MLTHIKYNHYAVTDKELLHEDAPAHTMKAYWGMEVQLL
jgi:hypothetical protein